MVALAVEFRQFRAETGTDSGHSRAHARQMLSREHATPILRTEDQMHMKCENTVSAPSEVLHICHRPSIVQPMEAIKTLKLRIKDKHAAVLARMAREVNQVWNFCNETSSRAIRQRRDWLSGFDLQKLTAGFSKCDDVLIGSQTIQQVCEEYATRRKQFKKSRLNWRVSDQRKANRSLGWIPFKQGAAKYKAGQIAFAGQKFSLWDSYGLSDYDLRAGSFSADARGRWYLNVCVKVDVPQSEGIAAVGIDLGLKACATTSDGTQLVGRWKRAIEGKLKKVQRAGARKQAQREAALQAACEQAEHAGRKSPKSLRPGKTKQVRNLHAKQRNQRKDAQHKFSTDLVKGNAAVFVGNVSVQFGIAGNAKSTLDAGWSQFKTMLEYKSHGAGIVYKEINESWTTQTCNACGVISGPKGRAGLNKRVWRCVHCSVEHDRDVNAALNIRRRGLATLEEGAPA